VNAELIRPDDPRWHAFLSRVPHDAYHLPEYVEFAARHEGGAPAALFAASGASALLLPLVIRDLPEDLGAPGDWSDATSPYGFYASPLASDPRDGRAVAVALAALRDVAHAHGIVSAFVRLHPLRSLPADALAAVGHVETHGRVVPVDLTHSLEQLWSETRANHRTGIRKLTRTGFVASMDDWDRYGDFIRIYRATMERVAATSFYFFPEAYFEELRIALGEQLHLCTIVSPGGELAAAGVFCVLGDAIQYHLGATATAYLRHAPSKLMFDVVRRWAKERGCGVLNLGGGLGGAEDSLFHFKAGFSPLGATCQTFRMVVDDERYRALQARHREPGGQADDPLTGFFPAYRRPYAPAVTRSE